MSRTITLARDSGGDWEGLYIDGRLVHEAHSLDASTMLDLLAEAGVIGPARVAYDVDLDPNVGRFPPDEKDLPTD